MKKCFGLTLAGCFAVLSASAAVPTASIEKLHSDLWNRFVYPPGLLLDYTGLDGKVDAITAEDFFEGRPNALAYHSPKSNSVFFAGLYLDGILNRWKLTGAESDRVKARTLANGLLSCASVGTVPGFIPRGLGEDGKSHHALGSDDQTAPWFYGLWRYMRSGAATAEEKTRMAAKMVEVANALERRDWKMPADLVGRMKAGEVRGSFRPMEYRGSARLFFVARIMIELTGEQKWKDVYATRLEEKAKSGKTRLQIVEAGMPGEVAEFPARGAHQLWIFVSAQAAVRELATLESDPKIKSAYLNSLRETARMALPKITDSIPAGLGQVPYYVDWRKLNKFWAPQSTVAEATKVAAQQAEKWKNPGRDLETNELRDPFCAAWMVALCPMEAAEPVMAEGLQKFGHQMELMPWAKLSSSVGFFGESAWYLWQLSRSAAK